MIPDPNAPTAVTDPRSSLTGEPLYRLTYEEWICYEDGPNGELYGWYERVTEVHSESIAEGYAKEWVEHLDVRNMQIQRATVEWTAIREVS